jgi:iron complex transport system substrate-binding protein
METTEATTENETVTETETTLEAETASYTFTDDLDREVTVTSHDRVVTMIGSFTDIWNLAGGEEVVATAKDSWTSFDFGLSDSVINFGSHTEPDVEQIIAAEPDFIIASANTDADLELQETFENAGITVAYFSVSNFNDYLNMLKICTDITGREDLYEKNGSEVASQIAEVKDMVAKKLEDGVEAPTVLFLRASTSSIKAKGSEGTVGGEILADIGCINIADSDDSLLDDLSMEAIITANPDYIFITTQGTDADAIEANISETLLSNPAWTSLDAVNEGRYYMLEKELYNLKPNARWGEAYEKLADIIYGED